MSLDQNLFTLNLNPRDKEPRIVDLIDPSGTVHYRKERTDDEGYSFSLFDPMSESLLATVTAPNATGKQKKIELHNPTAEVELKHTGKLTFKWSFRWEEHDFEWKREECFILRKPDPAVLIAVTREPPGRIKTKSVQILDYNLNRFDIHDRKGLEIVMLSALLSFQDYSDDYRAPKREREEISSTPAPAPSAKALGKMAAVPPELPPKPANIKTGVERVTEMQRGDLSEVSIFNEEDVMDYAQYCSNLLEGDNMLFVTLRSTSAETVPKVLQVAHQTKRLWYHAGEEQELSQYVHYDKNPVSGKKEKRIIKLDDEDEKDKYKPPENLTVYLSKIPMPELQPKATGTSKKQQQEAYDVTKPSDKQKGKGKNKEKEKEKDKRGGDKFFRRGRTNSDGSAEGAMNAVPKLLKPEPNKLRNRSSYSKIPSHLANSRQPSPPHQSEFARSFYCSGGVPPDKLKAEKQRPVSMYGGSWGPPTDTPVGNSGERPASSLTGLFDKLRTR